jgi:hypothetical protein
MSTSSPSKTLRRTETASTLSHQFDTSIISQEQQTLFRNEFEHVEDHPYNSNVRISVALDPPLRFFDVVSGKINVQILSTDVPVKELTLFLQGRESIENQSDIDGEWESNSKELFSRVLPICGNGVFSKGIHSYNFSSEIPAHLPGTFAQETVHYGKLIRASISYYATVQIEIDATNVDNMTYHKEFIVGEDFSSKISKPVFASKHKDLGAGSNLIMKYQTDRDVFFAPSNSQQEESRFNKIFILSEILNESYDTSVDSITIKLMQYMILRGKGKTYQLMNEIVRRNFTGVQTRVKDIRMNCLRLPSYLQPSANGELVQVFYRLEITCSMPATTSSEMTVTLPIDIAQEQEVRIQKRNSYTHKRVSSGVNSRLSRQPSKNFKNYYGQVQEDNEEEENGIDPWEDENYHVVEPLLVKPAEPLCPCCCVM